MRWAARLLPLVVLVAACTPSSQPATTPATAPPTTQATTTTVEVTTTLDRISEIEAIYQDLEQRRLDALYRGDREAFRALFANDAYAEASMGAFEAIEFNGPPGGVSVSVAELLWDDDSCVAATVESAPVSGVVDATAHSRIMVIEIDDGAWGLSFVGEGWACEGAHPFSS